MNTKALQLLINNRIGGPANQKNGAFDLIVSRSEITGERYVCTELTELARLLIEWIDQGDLKTPSEVFVESERLLSDVEDEEDQLYVIETVNQCLLEGLDAELMLRRRDGVDHARELQEQLVLLLGRELLPYWMIVRSAFWQTPKTQG